MSGNWSCCPARIGLYPISFLRLFVSEKKSTEILQKVAQANANLNQMMTVKWLSCCQLSHPDTNTLDILQLSLHVHINLGSVLVNYIFLVKSGKCKLWPVLSCVYYPYFLLFIEGVPTKSTALLPHSSLSYRAVTQNVQCSSLYKPHICGFGVACTTTRQ